MGWLEEPKWQLHISLIVLLSMHTKGALAGPVVDPHVTAVWGNNVTLKCIIEINGTITQISWEKIHGKSKQTIAVHHPEYGFSVQGEYQGRVSFKNYSLTDATITLNNISFSDSGEYVCKAVTFPLGNAQSSTTVTVLVEPIVSLTEGPNSLIDGENQTIAAICTAATGKPAADIDWEGGLGEMESSSTLFPNETVTVVSQYKLIPTKFARGRRITCVVRHPALEKELRYPYTLDVLYAPEVSVTGYDGNWFIGREHVQLRCNADANPLPMEFTWTRLDGQWPEGLMSSNNTLHFNSPLTFNYTGTYVCKVTNSLGQRSDQKTIYILVEPIVSLTKGPNSLIDGENQTIAAICTAATGKPAADIDWEGGLGEMESSSTLFPNETVTVVSQYKLIPTKFARGRRITCVVRHPALEKELRYPYTLDILYAPEVSVTGYDGNWFIGREHVQLRCNADANPLPMEFTWTRLDGQWPEGLMSSNNTLHFNSPLTFNYTGTYVCKVTNSLGQRSDQKTIYILDPTTTTTRPPTVPWHPSTDGIRGLATEPKLMHFPTSTLSSSIAGNWGTIITSAVGGTLFLILVSVLVGIICYRRRRMVRRYYFARNYILPSDMQEESQIDVLQSDDVDSYPDSIKKE